MLFVSVSGGSWSGLAACACESRIMGLGSLEAAGLQCSHCLPHPPSPH